MRVRKPFVFAALAAAIFIAQLAQAHQFAHPKVLRLGIKRDRLLLSLSYDVNPGDESRRLRALFDRNSDGKLDPTEQQKITKFLEDTAFLWTRVIIAGTATNLERLELAPTNLDAPATDTRSLGISAVYTATLTAPASGLLSIELFDRDKDRTRHVPVTVDLAPNWEVAFASQGELEPKSRQIRRILLTEGSPLVMRLRGVP